MMFSQMQTRMDYCRPRVVIVHVHETIRIMKLCLCKYLENDIAFAHSIDLAPVYVMTNKCNSDLEISIHSRSVKSTALGSINFLTCRMIMY